MNIEWTRRARKDLRKLDIPEQARVVASATRYAESGFGDIRKVETTDKLALRVGDWRIFFKRKAKGTIQITAVRLRDKAYKK